MRRARTFVLLWFLVALGAPVFAQTVAPRDEEWTAYGRDALGSRFSPLTQITRANVTDLKPAWTYRTGEAGAKTRQTTKFEATPLMVDGALYLSTPFGR